MEFQYEQLQGRGWIESLKTRKQQKKTMLNILLIGKIQIREKTKIIEVAKHVAYLK